MTGAAFRVFATGAMLGVAVFLLAPLAIIVRATNGSVTTTWASAREGQA